jgi:signal peptidase I
MAKVQGQSMSPRYTTGDSLVVLKTFRLFTPVKVGDIVIIKLKHGRYKGEEIVKRVVFVQNEKGDAPWPKYIRNSAVRLFRQIAGFPNIPPVSKSCRLGPSW